MHNISQINLWMARPADRSEFQRRANGSAGLTILEKLNSFLGRLCVFLLRPTDGRGLGHSGFCLGVLVDGLGFKD